MTAAGVKDKPCVFVCWVVEFCNLIGILSIVGISHCSNTLPYQHRTIASNPGPLPYERERRAWYPLSAHAPITGHGCYEYNYK